MYRWSGEDNRHIVDSYFVYKWRRDYIGDTKVRNCIFKIKLAIFEEIRGSD